MKSTVLLAWSIGCAAAVAQSAPVPPAPASESARVLTADAVVIPTEVVMLVAKVTQDLEHAHADMPFTLLQMPLNYHGMRLVEHAYSDGELPDVDPTRVRAVGTWLAANDELPDWVWPWLQRQPAHVRVLHLGSLQPLARGDDGQRLRAHLRRFGLGYDNQVVADPSRIKVRLPHPDHYPFESKPVYSRLHLGPWNTDQDNTVWVATQDVRNPRRERVPVVTGSWGGIGLQPWFVRVGGVEMDRRWYADPFAFCRQALGLDGVPAADPSVWNGRRMFVLHVDGDGFESASTVRLDSNCGAVFRDRIVDEWQVPMTISFIVASLTDEMQPAKPTARMRVAREIAERAWVELASHSVLHPLNWRRELHPRSLPRSVVWYRELNGYVHGMAAEVGASIAFIDQWLAPPAKRCRVMLWSGAANPTPDAIRAVSDAGCVNLNGGLFRCDALHDSVGYVSPWGRQIGDQWQTFVGAPNENIYPGFFTTMPGAFGHVTQTIERTGGERILKPANVYCHFYSAEHPARLAALEQLLKRWIDEEETVPVFASTYAKAVQDAQYSCEVLRTASGFRWRGFGNCRTLRIEGLSDAVDWENSRGLLGMRRLGDRLFLHLAASDGEIAFAAGAAAWLHIEHADCGLARVRLAPRELRFDAKGFRARRIVIAGAPPEANLRVAFDGHERLITCDSDGRYVVELPGGGTSEVRVWRP